MRLPMNPFLKRNEVCVDVPHKPALGMALEIEGETPRPSTLGSPKALQMHHGHSLTGAALKSGASVQPAHSRRMHTQNHTLSGDSSDLTAQSTFSAASFLAWSSNSWQQVAQAADSSFL